MKGKYIKRKLKKFSEKVEIFLYETRRFFVKLLVRKKDFSIISNNCWAGRVYQYLDMPYLSPTAGLYFFAPDYIKFVSDLKKYLDAPLEFISPEDSRYFEELKKRNQLDKPIGRILDVEIVFLHYPSKEEALEKWNRRKERVNFDHIILKFSRMNLCSEKEIEEFFRLPFKVKAFVDTKKRADANDVIFFDANEIDVENNQVINDSTVIKNKHKLIKLLNIKAEPYRR